MMCSWALIAAYGGSCTPGGTRILCIGHIWFKSPYGPVTRNTSFQEPIYQATICIWVLIVYGFCLYMASDCIWVLIVISEQYPEREGG